VENKNWIVGLVILVLIVGLGVWGFTSKKTIVPSQPNSNSAEPFDNPATPITANEPYFDANAQVMEFYQPNCGWCQKESPILTDLAKQGYRVKPMNTAADQSLWTKYGVTGTPTFMAANGDKLAGYQTEDQLKAFLDAHK
jgi:protein-disulfide isomerase